MNWYELSIYTTEEASDQISNFFHEIGAGGVSIEESGSLNKERDTSLGQWYEKPLNNFPEGDAEIKAYFSQDVEMDELKESLSIFLNNLKKLNINVGKADINSKVVNEEDWANAWKQYFKPVRITERITIKPTWENYEASDNEAIVELDPGMAFGTGTHATTALCLKALEKAQIEGKNVIDVGTGSGILSIAAMKLGANHVLALDLDPVAVSSAKENVRINDLTEKIDVELSDLLQVIQKNQTEQQTKVRVVVANILAEIILTFIDDVYNVLEDGGLYIASGIIKQKEADVVQALEKAHFKILERLEQEDWVVITAQKS
ncbi:50S ribosomal protein L11 methyltransferase [Chengkuizengella axinellae]|uniref:Ribosomal protein L11 methyltransferase n=1 Tax=Chengkuizengella axinellae TaxID=3064388 RepID=A0ABT9IW80_9BACL|nr:50S ribosomal protein L11 methyltransferase [Chengkuizengella sp. 2205SS18-9]MDP5273074.1 50S ribosomal protein L11 methyltransferase [Chengkuizengella sp. 2205SS18-9]